MGPRALRRTGPPPGVRGPEILLEARIVAVADARQAVASRRPYRVVLGEDHASGVVTGGWRRSGPGSRTPGPPSAIMGAMSTDARARPDDRQEIARRGLGPFVTERTLRLADGTVARWESRRARKHTTSPSGSTWWAPRALGWWIGVLFAVGSACFAVAAVPTLDTAVGTRTDNLVYFVGSLFFTTAGILLYAQVVGVDAPGVAPRGRTRRLLSFQPHRIDWLAAVIQSVGTLFFNVSTGHALWVAYSSPTAANQGVWRPDALGSVCFLVSSYLSYAEVCHGAARWQPASLSWWITVGNLVGSVAFGVSAIGAKVLTTGELRNASWSTAGTFVGGLCFLGASILLLPERTEELGADAASYDP